MKLTFLSIKISTSKCFKVIHTNNTEKREITEFMIFKEDGRVCEMKNGAGVVLASIIKCSHEFKTNCFPFLSLPDIAYVMEWQDERAQGHPAHSSYFSTRILKKLVTSCPIISFALSNHSSYSISSQICWHKVIFVPDSEKSTLCPAKLLKFY